MKRLPFTIASLGLTATVVAQTDTLDSPWDRDSNLQSAREAATGAGADIWLRDCTEDGGAEPSSCPDGTYWLSPDIWMSFGGVVRDAGLVVEDRDVASSWRVQIRNRGDSTATSVQVTLWYRSNAGGLHFPDSKCQVIGTKVLALGLDAGTSRIVTIVGSGVPQPPSGSNYHYCVGAVLQCDGDPAYTTDTVVASNNKACTNNPYLAHRLIDDDLVVEFNAETPPGSSPGLHAMQLQPQLPPEWHVSMETREVPQGPWVPYEPGQPFWMDGTEEFDVAFRLLVEKSDDPMHGELGRIDVRQEFVETGETMGGIGYVLYQDNDPPMPIVDLVGWSGRELENRLSWSVPMFDTGGHDELVAYFEVHRSLVSGFEATEETLVEKTAVDADENAPRWQYVDDDIVAGEAYYYRVVTRDYGRWSSESNEFEAISCSLDFDRSADIGFFDLLAVLAAWGPCELCVEDIDVDGEVGFADLLILLANWGACP